MLSELSSFVKMTKSIQSLLGEATSRAEFPDAQLESLVLRAFKTVLRAVRYLDVWEGAMQNLLDAGQAPLTPPSRSHSPMQEPPNLNDTSIPAFEGLNCHFSGDCTPLPKHAPVLSKSLPQTPVEASRPASISHRVSCVVPASPNMVSGKLGALQETFLSHLASFVSLQYHSRTSFEVLHATMQACFACRDLLALVNEVWNRDSQRSHTLASARDDMYRRIASLASAARENVRFLRAEEDGGILEGSNHSLVDAARACIRTAGQCTRESRNVIDRIGDFEYVAPSARDQEAFNLVDSAGLHQQKDDQAATSLDGQAPATPAPQKTIESETTTRSGPRFFHKKKVPSLTLADSSHSVEEPLSSSGQSSQSASLRKWRVRNNSVTAVSHRRDSERSSFSQTSTRATSPDMAFNTPRNISFTNSSIDSGRLDPDADDLETSLEEPTFSHELVYNKCGQIVGGSLPALVERLTSADVLPGASFVSTFFLTFRLFATPKDFAQALSHRYEWANECPRIASTVRLRVYNVFKNWLELYWRPETDRAALVVIETFATQQLQPAIPTAAQRLKLAIKQLDHESSPSTSTVESASPAPSLSKSQFSALKSWNVGVSPLSLLELDPLEVARQITIRESRIFCAISPHELLGCEWTRQGECKARNVRALTRFSTDLTNAVANSILQVEDVKKRAIMIKMWSKVVERLLELANYHSFMALVCSLTQSSITRLKRTWDCVSVKTKQRLERFKKIIACERNFAMLRQTVQSHNGPGIPCMGLYLTDLNFIEDGNPNTRQMRRDSCSAQVINFDKHMKTTRIVEDIQRFQLPYNLTEVNELQAWLREQLLAVQGREQAEIVKDLYQRSLILEPRTPKAETGSGVVGKDRLEKLLGGKSSHGATSSISLSTLPPRSETLTI